MWGLNDMELKRLGVVELKCWMSICDVTVKS